jgi:hypothetical protein
MPQSLGPSLNCAQIDYWNATAGQTWAQFQTQLDAQIEPLGLEALRALAPRTGERIIDIGCGWDPAVSLSASTSRYQCLRLRVNARFLVKLDGRIFGNSTPKAKTLDRVYSTRPSRVSG